MFRGRFFQPSGTIWKPKNPHSLEYLKYLYGLLTKNATVTEQNRGLLVEALRAIAEILIWGDQNDATVFDFFLEKNMLSYFLKIMKQKCGRYVCVQLLQTLNILFENIRHATSLYYLLSNNHVNSIITHRFDFSDEEIMAYYISFLKTLSLKLNSNTVHFFFNEQTNDFPLYTEAIKFFNHSESMVRIAVRTLTLNVYRISDTAMLKFIRDKTAAPYFSNLVWFIGDHIAEMDRHVQADSKVSRDKLEDLVAEHLDHIHYVNDILCLGIEPLNEVLTEHLIQRLFLPLYLGSLAPHLHIGPHVSRVLALFLLTQVFLIIKYQPLVEQLLTLLLFGDAEDLRGPSPPVISSSSSKDTSISDDPNSAKDSDVEIVEKKGEEQKPLDESDVIIDNCTDEEKLKRQSMSTPSSFSTTDSLSRGSGDGDRKNRPLFSSLLSSLDCTGTDHGAFYTLTLFYAIGQNEGVSPTLLEAAHLAGANVAETKLCCDRSVLQKLVTIFCQSCEKDSQVRLVTVELASLVLRQLVLADDSGSFLQDVFYAQMVGAKELATDQMTHFYKTEDMFLDLFEDEYQNFQAAELKVHMLSNDGSLLLPPSSTPFSGIEFSKRLPCGLQEQARRVIRVYFVLRQLLLDIDGVPETRLPLSKPSDCVYINDCLNLNNSDLLSCTVVLKNNSKAQRFLVTDGLQLILVEPDAKRLGWGVVKFVAFLQGVELTGDKDDSRALQVTVHQAPSKSQSSSNSQPLLTSKFMFDDHIRCMAAKQRLTKGRIKARQYKMDLIADMLEIPRRDSSNGGTTSPIIFRSMKTWKGKAPGWASLDTSQQNSTNLQPQMPGETNRSTLSVPSTSATPTEENADGINDESMETGEESSAKKKGKMQKKSRCKESTEMTVDAIPLEDMSPNNAGCQNSDYDSLQNSPSSNAVVEKNEEMGRDEGTWKECETNLDEAEGRRRKKTPEKCLVPPASLLGNSASLDQPGGVVSMCTSENNTSTESSTVTETRQVDSGSIQCFSGENRRQGRGGKLKKPLVEDI